MLIPVQDPLLVDLLQSLLLPPRPAAMNDRSRAGLLPPQCLGKLRRPPLQVLIEPQVPLPPSLRTVLFEILLEIGADQRMDVKRPSLFGFQNQSSLAQLG